MSESNELARECAVFARYLCDAEPDEYVLQKYLAAHVAQVVELPTTTRLQRRIVALARRSPLAARALDSYSRIFDNGGLLRRKLVLLLAILETRSPHAERIDAPTPGSSLGMLARMAWLGAVFALLVVASAIALIPVRLANAFGGSE